MDPNFAIGHYELGQAFEQKDMHDQAIAEFQKAIEISGHSGVFDSNLAYVYAVLGRKEEAIRIAKDLEAQHDQNPSAEANIALIYVGLGDQDQAITWLNKGYEVLQPIDSAAPGLRSSAVRRSIQGSSSPYRAPEMRAVATPAAGRTTSARLLCGVPESARLHAAVTEMQFHWGSAQESLPAYG